MVSVLFVDDNVSALQELRGLFAACDDGWDAAFVPGAEVALFLMEERPVDAVVASTTLTDMPAATFLRETKQRYPRTARIALSAPGDKGGALRALPVANQCVAKNCGAAALAGIVQRTAALQQKLFSEETRALVAQVGSLPSLPSTLAAVDALLGDDDCSPGQVADVMSADVAMVAKVLQLVNSPYFGLRAEIKDLRQAVAYLGIESLRQLAVVGAAFKAFVPARSLPQGWLPAFNAHSVAVASTVAQLARGCPKSEAHVVGTLHDIGELVVAERAPEKLALIAGELAQGVAPDDAEARHLGTTLPVIGGYLLSEWGMSNSVVDAITCQRELHQGPPKSPALRDALRLADELVAREAQSGDPRGPGSRVSVCNASLASPLPLNYARLVGLDDLVLAHGYGFQAL
ncbi:MAG TPA: HDOD domain-containing protein [Acidimicrobiales bacterium]|nr:HDOD domain-containing protein [Acidimicrobiales bacterium]